MCVRFHPWTLGFRQFSFSHIAQVLQSHSLHVFGRSLLYQHALVPSPFRVQVSCSPRSHCPELRPPQVAIPSVRDTAHGDAASGTFNAVATTSDRRAPAQSIAAAHYEQTADYLLEQLRAIRRAYPGMVLRRFRSLVQNILFMGLYDAMTDATRCLALCTNDPIIDREYEWWCPTCGTQVHSHFCPSCGQSPHEIVQRKETQ